MCIQLIHMVQSSSDPLLTLSIPYANQIRTPRLSHPMRVTNQRANQPCTRTSTHDSHGWGYFAHETRCIQCLSPKCDNTSRALSQGTSRICSAVPSSRDDFRASVRWITMPSVLQITNAPFTHLTNSLPAGRRSTLMHLCPFTLVLHAAIIVNASRCPPKK